MAMNSQQIMAGVAGAAVLVLGAYALGRQQAAPEPAVAGPVQAATQAQTSTTPAAEQAPGQSAPSTPAATRSEAPTRVATRPATPPVTGSESARAEAGPVSGGSAARLCEGCASVVAVHSEVREGQASGLGVVGGAVIGGLLGSQVGGGTGKKIATVGGAVAGGYAGNEIEKRQRSQTIWRVKLRQADGSLRSVELAQDPQVHVGEVVRWRDGRLERP